MNAGRKYSTLGYLVDFTSQICLQIHIVQVLSGSRQLPMRLIGNFRLIPVIIIKRIARYIFRCREAKIAKSKFKIDDR
jgi:hypothetical protein